ncbi:MAG TPA: EscU/YscU/HrcU family type III secretion system export apparatus switch protein [Opitutaceae bacterium]|jgi:flagellar biosynthetic protein FlhB|nr:EscU/YscU/HrcU family type III secretion system export apparatus switch protein [Opitutaceae bacterium]OQB97516.1 MAG: Flagellar biosynthetic protein FlhB [Verrucomicrobia bacterium ADurb.Bin122]MBP8962051.1 EscU/YscU/HrcU family type III secretion system export apparatus switch protein [Opitutaceae bacterium]HOD46032.1 EscU/YscU/HrcU family type III secretion system export apparatus switch protein [Opitutaceae bacterium]HOF08462.1 EscU/YscU/HrcU family type III secretion system export appar
MADQDNDQKTEQPTDKKVSEAMERGQFARSQELQIVCILGAALWVLSLTTSTMATELHDLAVNVFSQLGHIRLQLDTVPTHLMSIVVVGAKLLGPVVGAGAIAALLAGGFQSGFQLTPKALEFKPERLNPVEGFQRIFSKATLVHAGIDLLKLLAIGFVLWTVAQNLMKDPIFNSPVEPAYVGDYLQRATTAFLSRLLLALGVIAAISYSYEKYKTHNDLMMSREEIKEEHRQAEGDANSKAAMRRMARRLMQRQMLAAVPTADVVVTNPTHYAVALKYERGVDAAPVVLAKGENGFAQRIKALAAENGVPMVENRPVARALYAFGKVGEAIPGNLYQAVAEILAFVYRTHRYYFFRLKSRRAELAAEAPRATPAMKGLSA